jgi:hypothetical protein
LRTRFSWQQLWLLAYVAPVIAAICIAVAPRGSASATCAGGGNPSGGYWSSSVPGGIPIYHRIIWSSTLNCTPDYGAVSWTFAQFSTSPPSPYLYQSWRTWNCGVAWNSRTPGSYSGSNYDSDYVDYTDSWCGLQSDSNAYFQGNPGGGTWHYLNY